MFDISPVDREGTTQIWDYFVDFFDKNLKKYLDVKSKGLYKPAGLLLSVRLKGGKICPKRHYCF